MTDLLHIRLQQAQTHARAGNIEKAIDLLEQARALAHDDRRALVPILRELIDNCRLVGREEQASQLSEELAALAPGIPADRVDLTTVMPRKRRGPVIAVTCLAVALIVSAAVITWLVADRRYGAVHVPPQAGQERFVPGVSDGIRPSAGLSPATSQAASLDRAEGAPAVPDVKQSPAKRLGVAQAVEGNVGLLLHVATYEGTVGGRVIRLEIPVGGGTCFAVGRDGLMLTNKHVATTNLGDVPLDCVELGLPTLTRRGFASFVCFGREPSKHFRAALLHHSPRYDLSVLRIDRPFRRPLRLAANRSTVAERAYAVGFPIDVIEFLTVINAQEVMQLITQQAATGRISVADWFASDAFAPTVTAGIVSAADRRIDNASYIQIDAKTSPGSSGGPVLNDNDEVIGIVSLGMSNVGHEAYNFALSVHQLAEELEPYLGEERDP